jgi:hypothetical protein
MVGRRALSGVVLAGVVVGAVGVAGAYYWRHRAPTSHPAPKTAVVVSAPPAGPGSDVSTRMAPTPTPLPASVFVKVPYTAQSPFNSWGRNDPHEEYCEAAAVLMVGQYFQHDARDRLPASEADSAMAQLVSYERRTFPGVMDLSVADMGVVGAQFYSLAPAVVPVDPDVIKRSLAEGRPVIIPVMTHGVGGQKIAPFYGATNVYHVIVLTGYDSAKDVMYTNDAGFMQGQNYPYSWSTLSTAIDAQSQKYPQGRVMLVFSPR